MPASFFIGVLFFSLWKRNRGLSPLQLKEGASEKLTMWACSRAARCVRLFSGAGPCRHRRHYHQRLIPIDPVTSRNSFPYSVCGEREDDRSSDATPSASSAVLREEDRLWYDNGVNLEAKQFAAEAEHAYHQHWEELHATPGGPMEEELMTEGTTTSDSDGGGIERRRRRLIMPFGETKVGAGEVSFTTRGLEGELALKKKAALQNRGDGPAHDEMAQLNLKKERQLRFLLGSSELPLLDKAKEVSSLLLEFISHEMSLQPSTAEELAVLFSLASVEMRLQPTDGSAVALDMDSMPFLLPMRQLYAHMKSLRISPTPLLIEYFMVMLDAVTVEQTSQQQQHPVFQLAQRLMLDCDRFLLLPTHTALAAYIHICESFRCMQFAIAQVTHAVRRLHIPVDAGMAAALVRGFTHCGEVESAIAILSRLRRIPFTRELLNASLEALVLSRDPMAAFSLHDMLLLSNPQSSLSVRPDTETYTLLLLACEQTGFWHPVLGIAKGMERHRVKGSPACLNLLLKGLLMNGMVSSAAALYSRMQEKKVGVNDTLKRSLTAAIKKLA